MPCPHCHQNAPIVYKGVFAFCSACDKPRAPFSGKALNFAGQPAKVGGHVGRVVGFLVLVLGLLLAAALALFFQFLFPAAMIGYAVGLPIALISLVVGFMLVFFSGRLRRSGSEAERQARVEALYGLAVHRGGTLTVADAARALQLQAPDADALLRDPRRNQSTSRSSSTKRGSRFTSFRTRGCARIPSAPSTASARRARCRSPTCWAWTARRTPHGLRTSRSVAAVDGFATRLTRCEWCK